MNRSTLSFVGGVALGATFCFSAFHFYRKRYFSMYSNETTIIPSQCSYQENVDIDDNFCYTPLDDVILDYLKEKGLTNILEMCAGSGSNARMMRNEGFNVLAYDLKTDKENAVNYAVCGSIEHLHPNRLLFLSSGICSEKSIENFGGEYVLLGGHGKSISVKKEEKTIVRDMTNPVIEMIDETYSFPSYSENRGLNLDVRPSYKFMSSNGFRLENMWFTTNKDTRRWNDILYVFQLWKRDLSIESEN